jgi:uncharacterized protein (DUF1015 family)
MADIAPFAGLRYSPDRIGDIGAVLCPPYDVISEEQHLGLEGRHAENVVRLELPRGNDDARYTTAARLLASWIAEGIVRPEGRDAFYVYEQQFRFGGREYARRGFFAAVRLEPFERRVVLPHERTLSAPKEDRRRLVRATRTQISPIFGLYRDGEGAAGAVIDAAASGIPAVDTTTTDGVRHRLWVLDGPAPTAELQRVLREKQILIADGHHRYETMLSMAPELRSLDMPVGAAASDYAMMFLARAEDPGLLVLPTHRMVSNLPDFEFDGLRAAAGAAFDIAEGEETTASEIDDRLAREGADNRVVFAVRAPGRSKTLWLSLKSILDLSALGPPALRRLDVTVLHGIILGPILAIDAAAMANQSFLTYTHDTEEALARLAAGEVQAAFFMNATKVDEVLTACEGGCLLPQKSTYFLPKLATGLVMYRLDGSAPRLAR